MTVFNIMATAIALAMDAFAIAIFIGGYLKEIKFRQFLRISLHFGLFQTIMPVIGWSMGLSIRNYIGKFDHWITFFLLAGLGTKMIWEVFNRKDDDCIIKDPTREYRLIVLSTVTSIDALAVGLSISVLKISIWIPSIIIGITTLVFTVIGLYIGSKIIQISWFKKYSEIIGAVVLFIIGIKILFEHGVFSF